MTILLSSTQYVTKFSTISLYQTKLFYVAYCSALQQRNQLLYLSHTAKTFLTVQEKKKKREEGEEKIRAGNSISWDQPSASTDKSPPAIGFKYIQIFSILLLLLLPIYKIFISIPTFRQKKFNAGTGTIYLLKGQSVTRKVVFYSYKCYFYYYFTSILIPVLWIYLAISMTI